jgi:enterochelin esterase-like enzyme
MAWSPRRALRAVTRHLAAGLLVPALLGLAAPPALAQARTVRMSADYGGQQVFAILLPASYDASGERYPVVYLFPGGGQDHTAYVSRNAFRTAARMHEAIVVMPAPDRRYGSLDAEGQARYHDFVATELVAYVDEHYRTIPAGDRRAIGGLSQGGRIAVMTALRHPGVFGTVGAFSAALRGDAATADLPSAGAIPFFYVSCGTGDALLPASRALAAALEARGVEHQYHEVPGGGHDWAFWDPEVTAFLDLSVERWATDP